MSSHSLYCKVAISLHRAMCIVAYETPACTPRCESAAGCTHFIIGRDMAGSKSSVTGEDFYGAYDAQETAQKHANELHMQTVPSLNITYTEVLNFLCL